MQLANNAARYGLVAKLFHWGIFLLVLFLLLLEPLTEIFREQRFVFIRLHQSIGMLVLGLVLLRLLWRWFNPKPDYPSGMPAWQLRLSALVHWALYLVLLVQPIAGVMMVRARGRDVHFFDLFTIPGFAERSQQLADIAGFIHHFSGQIVLPAFIIFHLAAALYHHFWVKDNILRRMTFGA